MADQADIAWHFTGDKLRDGSPIPPIGHTLVHTGEIEMCVSGYHWSRTPFQALQYAPGPLLHKVRVGGKIVEAERSWNPPSYFRHALSATSSRLPLPPRRSG